MPWLLFLLAALFAYLAWDAAHFVAPRDDRLLPSEMRPRPVENPSSKAYRLSHGLGDVNQSVCLFAILGGCFATAAFWTLFQ